MQFITIIPSYGVVIAPLFISPVFPAPTPDISVLKTFEQLFTRQDASGKASPPTSSGLSQTVITGVPAGLTGSVFASLTGQETAVTVDDLTIATLAGPVVVLMT